MVKSKKTAIEHGPKITVVMAPKKATYQHSLSVVINTFNEEVNISRALASVKNIADEIIVCDMESTDSTVNIAKKFGAKVYSHVNTGYVEPARNFAIQKSSNEWVLLLDADEEISVSLSEKIKQIVKTNKSDYYRIPRKNIMFGKWIKHARWWPDYNIRLFKKDHVVWNEIIHTVPMTQGVGNDLEVLEDLAIIHHNYNSIDDYILRMNRYTSLHAKLLKKEGYEFIWTDLLAKPIGEFSSRYFFGMGYKDGLHGLALSLLQAFSELTLYLKIWQGEGFKEKEIKLDEAVSEIRQQEKTLHYWQGDSLFKETGRMLDRVRRKFKI